MVLVVGTYLSLSGKGRAWALIRGWALIRINTVICLICIKICPHSLGDVVSKLLFTEC